MVLEAARGRMPAYVDTGLNVVHVDDVAAGHLLAFERGRIGERYILGGENLPLGAILTTIARLVGRKPPRLRLPAAALMPIALLAEAHARWRGSGEPLVTIDGVRLAGKTHVLQLGQGRARARLSRAAGRGGARGCSRLVPRARRSALTAMPAGAVLAWLAGLGLIVV